MAENQQVIKTSISTRLKVLIGLLSLINERKLWLIAADIWQLVPQELTRLGSNQSTRLASLKILETARLFNRNKGQRKPKRNMKIKIRTQISKKTTTKKTKSLEEEILTTANFFSSSTFLVSHGTCCQIRHLQNQLEMDTKERKKHRKKETNRKREIEIERERLDQYIRAANKQTKGRGCHNSPLPLLTKKKTIKKQKTKTKTIRTQNNNSSDSESNSKNKS